MTRQLKWVIGFCFALVLLFCSSFVFFYTKAQRRVHASTVPQAALSKPLPEAHLVDHSGAALDDQLIRKGKVMLVFVSPTCHACGTESKFLRTVMDKRQDISFYGVVPFGDNENAPESAEKEFPFRIYYDKGGQLGSALGVSKVPIKVFVEDGVIRKAWGGATVEDQQKADFTQWLEAVQ